MAVASHVFQQAGSPHFSTPEPLCHQAVKSTSFLTLVTSMHFFWCPCFLVLPKAGEQWLSLAEEACLPTPPPPVNAAQKAIVLSSRDLFSHLWSQRNQQTGTTGTLHSLKPSVRLEQAAPLPPGAGGSLPPAAYAGFCLPSFHSPLSRDIAKCPSCTACNFLLSWVLSHSAESRRPFNGYVFYLFLLLSFLPSVQPQLLSESFMLVAPSCLSRWTALLMPACTLLPTVLEQLSEIQHGHPTAEPGTHCIFLLLQGCVRAELGKRCLASNRTIKHSLAT